MVTYDPDSLESGSNSELIALRWHPEDIARPLGMTLPPNEGRPIEPVVSRAENDLSGNKMEALVPSDCEGEGQSNANQTYPPASDVIERLREIILFKVNLASHEEYSDGSNVLAVDLTTKLENMGKSYYDQFHQQNELNTITKAIVCYSYATFLAHEGHPELPRRLERLGLLHVTRFQRSVELRLQDYEMASTYINRASSLAHESQTNPLKRLGLVTLLHESRFWRTGDPVDGSNAIRCKIEAISLTHQSSPGLPLQFESLGVLHEAQFMRTGEESDIRKAIEYLTQAVKLTPEDPRRLESLGISYRTRSMHIATTSLSDIKESIKYMKLALEHTPNDHKEYPRRLANLGVAWEAKFRRLGDLDDNKHAIDFKSQAVHCTSAGHPDLPVRLESLGVSYETRFQRLGQLDDIEAAIEYLTKAVELSPQNDVELSRRLGNLGTCHLALFECIKREDDIERSIEHFTRAIHCTPDYHPDLPRLLSNLGMAYKSRFEDSRDRSNKQDIIKAIEYQTHAVKIISRNDDHPDLPMRLDDLAVCYRTRFASKANNKLHDLQKAIDHGEAAALCMSASHVGRAKQFINLGLSYQVWYERKNDRESLSKALHCFRRAAEMTIAPPRDRFRSARHWARLLSSSTGPVTDCLKAYQTAIDLVPHLVLLGTTRQRYHDLHQVRDLGVEAASIAIRCNNNSIALEWLEQTRCVIWNQTLLLRSKAPLHQLRDMHRNFEFTNSLQEIINQLYLSNLEVESSQVNIRTRSTVERAPSSLLRVQLTTKYHQIISRVRELPGFSDFLQPKRALELTRAAQQGPVVIINCHTNSCDALIIKPGNNDITHVSLQDYSFEKAQSAYLAMKGSLAARNREVRGIATRRAVRFEDLLASLWEQVVKPILAALGYMEKNPGDGLPHVTWCPTGIMTFLPLHAAGDYRCSTQSKVFDYVVSSYTPTLTALLSSNPHVYTHDCKIIAIGQSETKSSGGLHLHPLPGTNTELERVKHHTQDKLVYSQLVGSDATTETVLAEMAQSEWVHLACHARQDVSDPAKSGFFLHGSTLDLGTIARQLFKNKGLAYLSACQTATGDDNLPDEVTHLASCMLMAGYPSVIASMWSVRDDDAPGVADNVYSHLMNSRSIANGEVAVALHNAIAALRNEVGIMNFDRWVQYIHMGL